MGLHSLAIRATRTAEAGLLRTVADTAAGRLRALLEAGQYAGEQWCYGRADVHGTGWFPTHFIKLASADRVTDFDVVPEMGPPWIFVSFQGLSCDATRLVDVSLFLAICSGGLHVHL